MNYNHNNIVCHIASGDLWAGAENQVFNILTGMREIGENKFVAIVKNYGKLYLELKKAGVTTFLVDEKQNNYILQLLKIYKIVKINKVKIIHSHRYKENIFSGLIKLVMPKIILIKTQHGTFDLIKGHSGIKMLSYRYLDLIFTKLLFDKIVGVSNEISKQFLKYVQSKKVVTIPNSISIRRMVINDSIPHIKFIEEKNIIRIGFLGRLVKIKKVNELIMIVKRLICERGCKIVLKIGGSGPEQNRLKKLVAKLELTEFVYFLGEIDNVAAFYKDIDLFFLTSIHEGQPTVIIEAMYFGKIVVARAVGGIPEIINNAENGFLFNNISDALEITENICNSPKTFQYISLNAYNTVINNYLNATQAKSYLNLYLDEKRER